MVAGGGFAAVEALLALRALLGDRAQLTVVAPTDRLACRPAAATEVFDAEPPRGYDLPAIAADVGARLRRDRVQAIAPEMHRVRLRSFATLPYDALVLALGARAQVAIPGALTFRDQRDVPQMRRLLGELRAGAVRRIAFAVPSGCSWPLPLYQLALLTARHAAERRLDAEMIVVSPARAPLDLFGPDCSRLVRGLLRERGVRFIGGSVPAEVRRGGSLALQFGGTIDVDRVVAAPQLCGPRLSGLPGRWWGFVPVDDRGRVEGLQDVYAAGDMTSFPIMEAGIAAQQADVIAHTIAAAAGEPREPIPEAAAAVHQLHARLLGGTRPLALRGRVERRGGRTLGGHAFREPVGPLSAPPRLGGRYLGEYLAGSAQVAV